MVELCEAQREHLKARAWLCAQLGDDLQRFRRLNPLRRFGDLLFFTGLFLYSFQLPGWLAVVPASLALNAFVLLVHEGMHGLLAAHKGCNRALSVALAATFGMSFTAYQVLHIRHHNYLGDERDPDDYQNYTSSRRLVWWLHFFRLALASPVYLLAIPLLAWKVASSTERRRMLEEYATLGLVYALVLRSFAPAELWQQWFVPLLLVGWFTNLRGLTQHGITDARDPFLASRSVHLPRPLAFLLLHENLHLEHHLFPEVPSYHLQALHERIYPLLPRAVVNHGYLEFLWQFFKATPRQDSTPIGLTYPQARR